jgi:hypothetical protein
MIKIITIIHIILCLIVGYGEWYLIFWLLSTQSNPLLWQLWVKVVYCFLGMVATESLIGTEISVKIKKEKDE